jgi:hypothetical protein
MYMKQFLSYNNHKEPTRYAEQTETQPFFQKSSALQNNLPAKQNNTIQLAPIGGPALAATPATASSPLPARVIRRWQSAIRAGNLPLALQTVVQEMIHRGEIDNSLFQVQQTTTGSSLCMAPNPQLVVIDGTVNGANTEQCACTTGTRLANPRVRIHPELVQYTSIGNYVAQTRAEILHSTLLHEFRHVRQQYEECNTPGTVTSSGICTDCNNPEEMDAYLAETEAGYDNNAIRRAWTRVYVNWNFLSANQQNIFLTRKTAAEARINSLFPGINWATDTRVQTYQRFCQRLPFNGSPGTCDSFMAPINATGSAATPPATVTPKQITE